MSASPIANVNDVPETGSVEGHFGAFDKILTPSMRVPSAMAPFDPTPVPEVGELALLAPWSEPPVTMLPPLHIEHGREFACPHCGTSAPRHRAVRDSGGAVVCASCGRSFVPAITALP